MCDVYYIALKTTAILKCYVLKDDTHYNIDPTYDVLNIKNVNI